MQGGRSDRRLGVAHPVEQHDAAPTGRAVTWVRYLSGQPVGEMHVAACGLPGVRLHDTRHGACSLMLAGGVPIEIVQLILGHSSPTVTRRVYAHLIRTTTAAQVEKAVELLTRHRPDRRPL